MKGTIALILFTLVIVRGSREHHAERVRKMFEESCLEHSIALKEDECMKCVGEVVKHVTVESRDDTGRKLRDRLAQNIGNNCSDYYKIDTEIKACGLHRKGSLDCMRRVFRTSVGLSSSSDILSKIKLGLSKAEKDDILDSDD